MKNLFGFSRLPFVVVLALLAPLLFESSLSQRPLHLGVPLVYSGDEPHYLIIIHSLILDGDLDLANNYAAVHKGSTQAGRHFAGVALQHHTVWFENGERRNWGRVYEYDPPKFDKDEQGRPVPRLQPGQREIPAGTPEYSVHPAGHALLLAPLLYPFRATQLVEPIAVACSAIAIILAFFLFRSLLSKYSTNQRAIDLVAVVAFLGTPAWHYGRTLYTEPFLLLFAVGAFSFALRGKSPLIAGAFIGLGILMKPPFALLLGPLTLMYLAERNFRALAYFLMPAFLGIAGVFYLNNVMFGSPLAAPQEWLQGSILSGIFGMLFSPKFSYLIIAPAILVAFLAWPSFSRRFTRDAIVLASSILLYFLLFASYRYWSGAYAYGARYLVPMIPLILVPIIALPQMRLWQSAPARAAVVAICAASIIINGIAAMAYWQNWDTNPPRRLAQFVAEKLRN